MWTVIAVTLCAGLPFLIQHWMLMHAMDAITQASEEQELYAATIEQLQIDLTEANESADYWRERVMPRGGG